mmetsp:Transcript_18010/g.59149  ORF Transcript_18010/g.59149 Transcript_18010/m.59149 type:complete len:459 (-) Transcript_18010:506-1882(-)
MVQGRHSLLGCVLMASLSSFQSAQISFRLPLIERIRLPCPNPIRGGSEATDHERLFQELLDMSHSTSSLRLRNGERGRGLFTNTSQRKGDTLLRIPLEACIREARHASDEEKSKILSRATTDVEDPEALTWDVRMAIKLLKKTGKLDSDDESEIFWMKYQDLLPRPDTLSQPLCLSPSMLSEFQHSELATGGLMQQRRLRMLFPDLMPAADSADSDYPSNLQWAFACVRSRAFTVTSKKNATSTDEEDDEFAFVPFLDMTNHGDPNADFFCDRANNYFVLHALTDIPEGREVLISYRAEMCNRIYQALYGFVPQGGNYNDNIEFPDSLKADELMAPLLEQALGLDQPDGEQILSSDPRLNSALMSFPLTIEMPEDGVDGNAEVEKAQKLLDYVTEQRRVMSTTLEEDLSLVTDYTRDPSSLDPRKVSAVHYRIERKRLLDKAMGILQGYIDVLYKSGN